MEASTEKTDFTSLHSVPFHNRQLATGSVSNISYLYELTASSVSSLNGLTVTARGTPSYELNSGL